MPNLSAYDVWHTRYYHGATYAGDYEMPIIQGTDKVPDQLISFSDSRSPKRDNTDAWVVPYEHDTRIERVWNNAFKYEPSLLEHPGIISWDFSMYRSMPFGLQLWNCFRGRLLGSLHERLGGECIPNLRPTDSRGLLYSFDGLPTEASIAMGTTGNLIRPDDRAFFKRFVNEAVKRLRPKNIIVYGGAPEQIFHAAFDAGVNVISFPTQTEFAHSRIEEVV